MSDETETTETVETTDDTSEDAQIAALLGAEAPEEPTDEEPEEPKVVDEVAARRAARLELARKTEQDRTTQRQERQIGSQAQAIIDQARAEAEKLESAKAELEASRERIREEEKQRVWDEIRRGGLTGLQAGGLRVEDLINQEVEASDPVHLARAATKKYEDLEKSVPDLVAKAVAKALEEREARTGRQTARQQEVHGLISSVESSDGPAADMPHDWIVQHADAYAAEQIRARRAPPTFAEVMAELDKRAAAFHRHREDRAARRRSASDPAGHAVVGDDQRPEGARPTNARTLASVSPAVTRRALSDEEEEAEANRKIAELFAKERRA